MKKLIVLLAFLVSLPIFAQHCELNNDEEIRVIEIVYKDIIMNNIGVTVALEKSTQDGLITYDVRFYANDNTYEYKGGEIEIDKFNIIEYDDYYTVYIYYSDNSFSSEVMYDVKKCSIK